MLLTKLTHVQLHREQHYTLARHTHWHVLHRTCGSPIALRLHARGVNENQAHSLTHMPEAPLEKFVLID